jgi:hypothetical protein
MLLLVVLLLLLLLLMLQDTTALLPARPCTHLQVEEGHLGAAGAPAVLACCNAAHQVSQLLAFTLLVVIPEAAAAAAAVSGSTGEHAA